MQREEADPDRQRDDQYDREWQENEDEKAYQERKGASYNITQKRAAQDPNAMAYGGRRPGGSNVVLTNTSAADVAGSARPVPMG
jgi:hypothetical protein